jgi:uridine monophosphate synthetase
MNFFKQLEISCKKRDSLLCVGLDPRIEDAKTGDVKKKIQDTVLPIIEKTLSVAAVFKPNIAFYERFGPEGLEALEDILLQIPEDTPVILDAKRGDIGSTAEAYADAVFRFPKVGAVTLSPYMGTDTFEPFLKKPQKGVFILCRTTNPGASQFQESVTVLNGMEKSLFLHVADLSLSSSYSDRIGLVVPGNDPETLALIRKKFPDVWFLVPGIGAQGGDAREAVDAGIRDDGMGIIINVSRSIAGAENPGRKADSLRKEINQGKKRIKPFIKKESSLKAEFLEGLINAECFKTGDFILKSGKHSPFYIDLRRIISFPFLLSMAVEAYASLVRGLDFDCIAGIPTAGLPLATALALRLQVPMIYPRIPVKPHGSGNKIEGEYRKGDVVLLLDDLITTGKSKEEAVELLRGEGLNVNMLAVLIQRGAAGVKDMERIGINLCAFAQIEEFLPVCRRMGYITEEQEQEMNDYVRKD